ncbi:MAG TPA: helix-turn-helix domain-containing protein [Solirubrobacteraceae bacterium]|jgi:transcriptional regulator with XRE-family HTH domain|nr:helix-turn-helix domain-containing protein [Solirubrobacteraceae bacterium]
MDFDRLMTERAVLAELGRRLARHRRERNWTQAEAAAQAGIGQATLQRIERGESVQMTSMVKLLRALDLLAAIDAAVPESIELPIARLERERRAPQRRRVRHGRHARSDREEADASFGRSDRAATDVPADRAVADATAGRSGRAAADEPLHRKSQAQPARSEPGQRRPWRWGDEPGET